LAADLLHHYRLDLRDELADLMSGTPSSSPCWLLALIEGLPADGAYAASRLGGAEFRGWSRDTSILADVWDILAATAMAGSKKKPPTYPRPGQKEQRTMSILDISPFADPAARVRQKSPGKAGGTVGRKIRESRRG